MGAVEETMPMKAAYGLAAGALLLVGTTSAFAQQPTPSGTADLKMATGESIGMASFTQEAGGVRLKAQVKGVPPGAHGIHVHAVGKCDAPDFMTAGGHFNPVARQHGLNNPQGAHAGDMPNLTVGADGTATFDFLLKDVTTATGTGSLFGPDGTALVIHAMPDDEMTDPTGNSGGRIACGVVTKTAASATTSAPAVQPSLSTSAPGPVQSPAPSALPRTGVAGVPIDTALPAAVTGLGALVAGLAIWRRRR